MISEDVNIIYMISEINNPSITFSGANGHWSIIFTSTAVYFVKKGWSSWYQGNPGIVLGAIGAIATSLIKESIDKMINKNKETTNLSLILSKAKKYYKFEINKLNQIKTKKTWRNRNILLDNVEPKPLEILVSKEQYDDFILHIKSIYNYDLINVG